MIVGVGEILKKAKDGGYAVGAFNVVNMETVQAILQAASEVRSPVILQVTEKTMDYSGGRNIFHIIKNTAEFYYPEVPVGIHLDHGKSFEVVQRAVEIGFDSVMYDGSRREYEDNLAMTKKVVEFCQENFAGKVSVQAELGSVPYLGEVNMNDNEWEKYMTDPGQAEEFVKETGISALAVAIGNAHGFAKERKEPDYARLEMINKLVDIPLILHGASDWENGRVKEVIKRGICCFNVDTATRMAFINNIMVALKDEGGGSFDMRRLLGNAREAIKEVVKTKMKYFGSDGKI
ncbi:MAG: Fructose-bisphosphate aldolase [Candidatus Moranbacteria bacterium GW2011_GWE2_35_2-]|nr:MAG: Fructose-bisphosphate aldolase [Candidatus Moranbacteria bacterium GW2011_GWE2_35_2-]KKQ22902.1 MAG: Fructose-bisphosphate aldolase [Candidatus Moranbacteria bacterium GW2011_GWF2_37_11]KKQ29260.1 MAG: Fructose-bisphosphate aldolase [Candidatus Moranbacteria bacterium GW2011_GWD1_37_17]KKQ30867.1 MAG: Fructose-bisphosphate aldolase [Candidatus Moranbacteria bacterium GW2011_GWE1_37_24]KKQ47305.1 MAG: Fructose-bisphosphate aldolase [Candidatus Moranbacteria bacterium GW2011_GWD2_37_9]HB